MGFKIIGTGSAIPTRKLKNDDLKEFFDTSDEWIRTRTGIEERGVITNESVLSLAERAARLALENVDGDISVIICATLSSDFVTPSLACLVAEKLGISGSCMAFDINMACCGFIYALSLAESLLAKNKGGRALIVAAESMSSVVDWTDRSTAVLFGDGAGAALIEYCDSPIYFDFNLKPEHGVLYAERGAGNCPLRQTKADGGLVMNGQEVYKFATAAIDERILAVLEKAGVSPECVDKFLLHQANIRIIQSAIYKLKLPKERFLHNIEKYGNTSAASVAILLDETYKEGKLKRGDKTVMCAFGAGLLRRRVTLFFKAGCGKRRLIPAYMRVNIYKIKEKNLK